MQNKDQTVPMALRIPITLMAEIRAIQRRAEEKTGYSVTASEVVRRLIRDGIKRDKQALARRAKK